MSAISSISLSGMNAAQSALSAAASNIAALGTGGHRRQQVEQASVEPAGVNATLVSSEVPADAIVTDLTDMLQAKHAFLANLAVFKTGSQMAGTLLNALA